MSDSTFKYLYVSFKWFKSREIHFNEKYNSLSVLRFLIISCLLYLQSAVLIKKIHLDLTMELIGIFIE